MPPLAALSSVVWFLLVGPSLIVQGKGCLLAEPAAPIGGAPAEADIAPMAPVAASEASDPSRPRRPFCLPDTMCRPRPATERKTRLFPLFSLPSASLFSCSSSTFEEGGFLARKNRKGVTSGCPARARRHWLFQYYRFPFLPFSPPLAALED